MTEANSKSVINEAIVKDNISRADMANAILSQELRECIETVTKPLTKHQNTIGVISSIRRQVLDKKIRISLHQLLEIVKPEVQQDINSMANPDISRKNPRGGSFSIDTNGLGSSFLFLA
ncbi:3291_t:CDS:2 [Acaulospora colombiana]|uniref:3291_t:CDS:1 n=1 Tax=Acaulospora colombiana TaxID=27376 RepID=A0ACA9L1K1_9GLOM|nr:3291_t:CDS:2 [Acaulospora colombiana]